MKKAFFIYLILFIGLLSFGVYYNTKNIWLEIPSLLIGILFIVLPATEAIGNWYDKKIKK